MQFLDRIDEIEKRAKAVNLSLWRLCRSAKVDYSRLRAWRQGGNATVRTLTRYVEALEAELVAVETRVRDHLAQCDRSACDRPAA